jgi:hypothetical protein
MMTTATLRTNSIEAEIVDLLDGLPLDSKITVKQFILFMYNQVQQRQPALTFPLVTVPVSKLSGLINLLSPGYEGNALKDTEAFFDEP